jgi:hypothetical protein
VHPLRIQEALEEKIAFAFIELLLNVIDCGHGRLFTPALID